MREITEIYIHCSATPPVMDIGAKEIRHWHLANGWSDIGYHYVIKRDGEVEDGRPIARQGAHAKGNNRNSIVICLVGGIDMHGKPVFNFTSHEMVSLLDLCNLLNDQYPWAKIKGHNEVSSKPCPCFNVNEWWYGL